MYWIDYMKESDLQTYVISCLPLDIFCHDKEGQKMCIVFFVFIQKFPKYFSRIIEIPPVKTIQYWEDIVLGYFRLT